METYTDTGQCKKRLVVSSYDNHNCNDYNYYDDHIVGWLAGLPPPPLLAANQEENQRGHDRAGGDLKSANPSGGENNQLAG